MPRSLLILWLSWFSHKICLLSTQHWDSFESLSDVLSASFATRVNFLFACRTLCETFSHTFVLSLFPFFLFICLVPVRPQPATKKGKKREKADGPRKKRRKVRPSGKSTARKTVRAKQSKAAGVPRISVPCLCSLWICFHPCVRLFWVLTRFLTFQHVLCCLAFLLSPLSRVFL